jgi:hypothetical protein
MSVNLKKCREHVYNCTNEGAEVDLSEALDELADRRAKETEPTLADYCERETQHMATIAELREEVALRQTSDAMTLQSDAALVHELLAKVELLQERLTGAHGKIRELMDDRDKAASK